MNFSSKIAFNTLAQVAGRMISVGLGLLITASLTRFLGAKGYGDYVFITSFVLFFVALSDLGLGTIGVREASRERKTAPQTFGNTLSVKLLLSFVALGILAILVVVLPQFAGLRPVALVAGLVLVFLGLRTSAEIVFQTKLRLEMTSLLQVLSTLILVLGIYLLSSRLTLLKVVEFWVLGALFSGVLGIILASRLAKIDLRLNLFLIKRLIKEALPLGLFFLTYSAYDRGIDSFMLKSLVGSTAVGFYGLSYKIHSNLILVAAYLMNSLFPLISSYQNQSRQKLTSLYRQAFGVLFVLGLLIAIATWLLAPLVIEIIGGGEFQVSVLALQILSLATFFAFLNHATGYTLVALGKQKALLRIALLALLTNIVFNWLLIPRFSFYGAAFVTVITEGLVFVFSSVFLFRRMNLKVAF